MSSFTGLFDPLLADEPVEEEELMGGLSVAAALDKRQRKETNGGAKSSSSAAGGPSPRVPSSSSSRPAAAAASRPVRSATASDLSAVAAGARARARSRLPSSFSEADFTSLPPEPQQGNIEYKLKLVNPTSQRLEHLVTQMKWRLREGQGEAIYEIGVEDNGFMTGLSERDLSSALDTLREMGRRLGATIQVLRQRDIDAEEGPRTVAEILVRKVPDDQQCIDLRVCVLGSADVGKSTLLGVLTQGALDNGRGRARLNMFRHLHEVQSGRTSSISHEILGFDSEGTPMDYRLCGSAEEICENSTKLLTFIDLAGHHKYLRTTITGLTGYSPHYVMLVVSASAGVVPMTQEHLGIAVALEVPFFIMVTKIDVTARPRLQATLDALRAELVRVGCKKVPLVVTSGDDSITAASNALKENVVPLFCVSSVTGAGLDKVKQFLHLLPPGAGVREQEKLERDIPEFQIDELFDVPGVGAVAGGLVTSGLITEGMTLRVGPFDDGSFEAVVVSSIKRNRAPCRLVRATQSAALALDIPVHRLRRGMVCTDGDAMASIEASLIFQANVCVLYHPTEIYAGFRTTVHVGNVRQTAVIEAIHPMPGIRSNDHASVVFRFIRTPEFIKVGARLLFREGRTKGFGRVTQVFPLQQPTTQLQQHSPPTANR